MSQNEGEAEWPEASEEIMVGLREWRLQHPQASWREIEAARDERLVRGRARLLGEARMASAPADWRAAGQEAEVQMSAVWAAVAGLWGAAACSANPWGGRKFC